MNIEDFLPKYPNINKSRNDMLNPYEDGFYESIFRKKEFYDEKLPPVEDFPTERGMPMKHQKIIARFLSSHTMYDALLLVHQMGSGKTCSAIGAIEQIKNETNNFKGAYIFAKGTNLLNNFVKELRGGLTERELVIRTRKLYEDFYNFRIGPKSPTPFKSLIRSLDNA